MRYHGEYYYTLPRMRYYIITGVYRVIGALYTLNFCKSFNLFSNFISLFFFCYYLQAYIFYPVAPKITPCNE